MANPAVIRLGWDAPLDIDWDFQLGTLRREIQRAAPGRSGALKAAFNSPDTVKLNARKNIILIKVGRQHKAWSYAAIQNWGGPRRDVIIRPKRGKALRFWWMGRLRFFAKVTMHAGQILASHFVERGVFEWVRGLQAGRGTLVQWRSKHYAAPLATRGQLSR